MGKKRISPASYNKFIDGLSLQGIKLVYSESSVMKDFSLPADVEIEEKKDFKRLDGSEFAVTHEYKLIAKEKNKREPSFHINAKYKLIYKSKVPINKEIFDVFSEISLPLHTWPYFRQFVHETTSRMGLPPLILDLLKFE
jgi:preprotein translocase subunit SecB